MPNRLTPRHERRAAAKTEAGKAKANQNKPVVELFSQRSHQKISP